MLGGARFLALDLYGGPERLAAAKAAHAGRHSDRHRGCHLAGACGAALHQHRHQFRVLYPHRVPGRGCAPARPHCCRASAAALWSPPTGAGKFTHLIAQARLSRSHRPKWRLWMPPGRATLSGPGCCTAWPKGRTCPRCVCLGAAAGSLKVGHYGAATTLPTLDEITSLADTLKASASQ